MYATQIVRERTSNWRQRSGWLLIGLFALLLCLPEIKVLAASWRSDIALSHGPLVPLIAGGLLWSQRDRLCNWKAADLAGLIGLVFATFLYLLAVWVDIDFLKPLSLIGMALGAIRFLGGAETFRVCLAPLGFLVFMIPWPTTLIERIAFPLQLISSTYAALFAGMLGVPVVREGVQIYIVPGLNAKPIYSIIVAQECSGLTSLLVLLALGYLIAYYTPVSFARRALLFGAVAPLALLTNSIRLTLVLLAGSHGNAALATWIHDHESPVLVLLCSQGLMALRHYLLPHTPTPPTEEGENIVSVPSADSERDSITDPGDKPLGT